MPEMRAAEIWLVSRHQRISFMETYIHSIDQGDRVEGTKNRKETSVNFPDQGFLRYGIEVVGAIIGIWWTV